MKAADLSMLPAQAQADALATGTISARDLLEASLARIADQDSRASDTAIGAFWHVDARGARAAADTSDTRRRAGHPVGPFDGLTIAIKDNVDVAGLPATAGIAAYRDRIAARDAPLVERLRAAGLVLIGKTALDEGALGATTDTPGFGRCHNPLQHGFTPGGSSGGSAAAVAARFTALAIGTDTMGSVRIPAAYCGVTGLKPTAGLVSRTGVMQLSSTLDCVGVLAQTPRDAACVLELMAGFDQGDAQSRAAPLGWHAAGCGRFDLSQQTIGVLRDLDHIGIEAVILESYEQACHALSTHGARLIEISINRWEPVRLRRSALLIAEAEACLVHAALIDDPAAASADFRAARAFGRAATPARLDAARAQLEQVNAELRQVLAEVDAIFLPTAPQRAFAHGTPAPANQADLTVLANAAGLPAIAFPWPASGGYPSDKALPASMQLIGRDFEEAKIVAIAEILFHAGGQRPSERCPDAHRLGKPWLPRNMQTGR
ncbi:MAG: amidase [Bosea sp. (in: a-proteobacteria)]